MSPAANRLVAPRVNFEAVDIFCVLNVIGMLGRLQRLANVAGVIDIRPQDKCRFEHTI
jgi:hypothetical protein